MPVPSAITDLSATAASNGPSGSESITTVDDYARANSAFIRQLYDLVAGGGGGTLSLNLGTGAITFCTGQLYKDASGNVGFGTSSPTARVTVQQANNTGDGLRVVLSGNDSMLASRYLSLSDVWQISATYNTTGAYKALSFWTSDTERLRVKTTGQVRFVPLSSAPSGAEAGDVYFNSTTGKHYGYDGSAWQALY